MQTDIYLAQLETTYVPCVLCGSMEHRYLYTNCSLQVVECDSCDSVFINPQPTDQALRAYHSRDELLAGDGWSSYFTHSEKQVLELWTERLNDTARWKTGTGTKVLDIGAGYGDFLHLASKLGWKVSGFEFSQAAAEVSRKKYGISLAVGDLSDLEFPARSFDLITMWHVLEHLREPLDVLRRCRTLLQEGGVLALEVPNLNFIVRKSYHYPMNATLHLYHFSPRTLRALVQKAGFKILECRMGNTGFQYSTRTKIYAKKALYALSRAVEKVGRINISDSIRLYATPDITTVNHG